MIKGIKFASIPVADQDRALEFYTQKLGFRILTDQPFNDEQRWIELGTATHDEPVAVGLPAFQLDEPWELRADGACQMQSRST